MMEASISNVGPLPRPRHPGQPLNGSTPRAPPPFAARRRPAPTVSAASPSASATPTPAAAAAASTLTIVPVPAVLGAEVRGLDVRTASPADVAAVKRAWAEHSVLLFRGQTLTPADLIAFSRHFGPLDLAPAPTAGVARFTDDRPRQLYIVSNVRAPDGTPLGALGAAEAAWHSDMSYLTAPAAASLLYAVEVPPVGGDTHFACMAAALDALPPDLTAALAGRRVWHDGSRDSAGNVREGVDPADPPGAWHPAIVRHPVTGRRALFLGRRLGARVEGLGRAASDALLDAVWAALTPAAVVWEHAWTVGDLVLWDNRVTLHRRDSFDERERRLMWRTQVAGTAAPVSG